MKKSLGIGLLLALASCGGPGGKNQAASKPWSNGQTMNDDGVRLQVLCMGGEWEIVMRSVERLVPPNAERQWVNRDVRYQFDNAPENTTKGTLNENRLDLKQADEGSTVNLNYGQDVVAELMKKHQTLTIRFEDGGGKAKRWTFNVEGSGADMPNDQFDSCPTVGKSKTAT